MVAMMGARYTMTDSADYTPEQAFAIRAATLLLQQSVRACTTAQAMLEFTRSWARLNVSARAAISAITHCSSTDELICLAFQPTDALRAISAIYKHRIISLRVLAWLMIHLAMSRSDVNLIMAERVVRSDRLTALGFIESQRLRLTPAGRAVRNMLATAKLPLGVE
jgi:hypothetical protein